MDFWKLQLTIANLQTATIHMKSFFKLHYRHSWQVNISRLKMQVWKIKK